MKKKRIYTVLQVTKVLKIFKQMYRAQIFKSVDICMSSKRNFA